MPEEVATVGCKAEWTLSVANVGKIASAEISSAPLIMLLGKNNSGKSYVASIIWAMGDIQLLLRNSASTKRRPRWFTDFCKRASTAETNISLDLDQRREIEVRRSFAESLERNSSDILERIFAASGFQESKLGIHSECIADARLDLCWKSAQRSRSPLTLDIIWHVAGQSLPIVDLPLASKELPAYLVDYLYGSIVNLSVFGDLDGLTGHYIPAGRTGLMLAYNSIVSELFGGLNTQSAKRKSTFSYPTTSFLQTISGGFPSPKSARYAIADWLEKELLGGRIIKESGPDGTLSGKYSYEVSPSLSIPIHASSSMVTELAPFVLMLRSFGGDKQIVFEEPEAHLHLSAQRLIAQAIVRLVNTGTNVVVTSHSDTFVQQINILMQLHRYVDRPEILDRLGYEASDVLDPNKVRGYGFDLVDTHTKVTELKKVEEGLVVPSLNETILQIQDQILILQDQIANA